MAVRRERRGSVEIVTLDRPEKRNALDPATMEGIGQALADAEADPEVAVVVITGTGPAFCAGMDLAAFTSADKAEPGPGVQRYNRFYSEMYPKPVIAAVNGTAVAGGMELMLACDIVVAAQGARFGIPEVKRGLVAGAGGTLLPLRIPLNAALELGLTGDLVDAERALALGLVNAVVPPDEVLEAAMAIAGSIAANAPAAVLATKALMYQTREMAVSQCWESIHAALPEVLAGGDSREGSLAFLEKRTPQWVTDWNGGRR